jgi:hypothetical protein
LQISQYSQLVFENDYLRETKEQSSRNDSKKCSKDIKRPLSSIDKSAMQKENSIAVEILVVSSGARLVARGDRGGRMVQR